MGSGTKDDPWTLKTPPGSGDYTMYRDETGDPAGAKREFEQALSINSEIRIDPLIVTDPTAIDAFNETRVGIQDRIRAERRR